MTQAEPESLALETLLGADAQRSPDMEAVWIWLLDQDRDVPNWLTLPPAEARALHNGLSARWNDLLPTIERSELVTVVGSPDIACQLLVPPHAEPGCILFLHGGGWAFGTLATYQRFMRLLALATRRRVLGVEYRLAPENPFPVPFEDCRSAWRWLVMQDTSEDFAGPLALAGDSAGANLAMAVMLDAIARGERCPDLGMLFYGAFAGGAQSASSRRFETGYGLTSLAMERFWDFYVPQYAERKNPLVSAVLAPDEVLKALPPLYLNAAGLDPLLCDTLDLVNRLEQLRVPHEFVLHRGMHHGFMQMSRRLPEAQRAIDSAAAFFNARVLAMQSTEGRR